MKMLLSAIVSGKKLEITIAADDDTLGESLKAAIVRLVCAQSDWLTDLHVEP